MELFEKNMNGSGRRKQKEYEKIPDVNKQNEKLIEDVSKCIKSFERDIAAIEAYQEVDSVGF